MGFMGQGFNFGAIGGTGSGYPFGSAIAHWAADDLSQANGSNVTSWTDRIGSYTLTEATNPPTFQTNVKNSLPAVRFANPSNLDVENVGTSWSNEFMSCIVVCDPDTTTKQSICSMIKSEIDTAPYETFEVLLDASKTPDYYPQVYVGDGAGGTAGWYARANHDGNPVIFTAVRTTATMTLWANTTDLTETSTPDLSLLIHSGGDSFRLGNRAAAGNSSPLNGDIFEVIWFNETLSAANRAANVAALMTKWGIT